MLLKCEDCGEMFEHFTVHRINNPKRFCDRCVAKRNREQYQRRKRTK